MEKSWRESSSSKCFHTVLLDAPVLSKLETRYFRWHIYRGLRVCVCHIFIFLSSSVLTILILYLSPLLYIVHNMSLLVSSGWWSGSSKCQSWRGCWGHQGSSQSSGLHCSESVNYTTGNQPILSIHQRDLKDEYSRHKHRALVYLVLHGGHLYTDMTWMQ